MIKLLAKLLIKDSENFTNTEVRQKYGVLCGGFGVFLNFLLFGLKFLFGTLAASVAMVADAFNNLSDAASSVVQIFGFKLSSKEADPEHPFGHGRIEYIAGLIVSFLILYMGLELLKSSFMSVLHPEKVEASVISVVIMVIGILVKFYMYMYNHQIAKKIDSVSMEATAKDSFGDMISTSVVIVSIILSKFTDLPLDGIGGLIVGCFILKAGWESIQDTISPLLGTAPSKEFVEQIEKELLVHKPIAGMHDLVVHDYGPGRKMLSLHAEVPGNMNIFELHDVIDVAEYDISKKFNCHVVIHMDPIDTENERLAELKVMLKEELSKIHADLHCHDVRMVPGPTHTNLIFDVVKPFDCKLSDEELKTLIATNVYEREGNVFCVITVDMPFVS